MFNSRSLLGIVLVLLGLTFLAVNFGWIDTNIVGTVFSYWPLFLIGWGTIIIVRREDHGDTVNGAILLVIGLLFLGNRLSFFSFSWSLFWRMFWPIALILFGWSMLTNRSGRGKGNYAIMGALERGGEPWELDNSSFVALFGGIELDLRQAEFQQKDITLDLTATFGGIDIQVPEDITVTINGTAILGGIDFFGRGQGGVFATFKKHQQAQGTSGRTLNIHCRCAFGGIEIKN